MAAPLTLTATLSSPVIPVTGQIRLVYLLLEVSGGLAADTMPLNLNLVLDVSDSMRIHIISDDLFRQVARQGKLLETMTDGVPAYRIADLPAEVLNQFPRRIDYVRQALRDASKHLRNTDSFSVTAFASQTKTLLPKTSGRQRWRLSEVAERLNWLTLGGETRMGDGLAQGLADLQPEASPGIANRMIVLTDGYTGDVRQCYALAQRARQLGVTLSTMGIGNDFNEELLIPLADVTGGNAHYIPTAENLPAAFEKELGAALAVTCRNVEIKVQLASGVKLHKARRVLPLICDLEADSSDEMSSSFYLGDYDPSAPPALLLELIVPPWPGGEQRLAQLLLAWDDPDQSPVRATVRSELTIQLSPHGEEQRVARVFDMVEKVGAFKLGTLALQAAERGDIGAATLKLRQAATRLMDMGEFETASDLLSHADSLEHAGQADATITRRLRYVTRQMTAK